MSKLAKALQFNQAGNVPKQSMDFVSADLSLGIFGWDKEYKLTAKLQAKAVLAQEVVDDATFDAIAQTKQQLQRMMIEEVFGEFRNPLHEIRKALYNQDCYKAAQLLTDLEVQMFSEGID